MGRKRIDAMYLTRQPGGPALSIAAAAFASLTAPAQSIDMPAVRATFGQAKQLSDKDDGHWRTPIYVPVINGKTVVAIGDSRIEFYPLRVETSERQMLAYLLERRPLYGSDPFRQRADGSFFYPKNKTELVGVVERDGLHPERFSMMHDEPTPWSELPEAVDAAEKTNSPEGVL